MIEDMQTSGNNARIFPLSCEFELQHGTREPEEKVGEGVHHASQQKRGLGPEPAEREGSHMGLK